MSMWKEMNHPYEYSYMSQVGQPLNNYYGYIAEGLFQSEDEIADSPTQELGTYKTQVGDIKYKDLNGDGKIDGTDKTYIGNPTVCHRLFTVLVLVCNIRVGMLRSSFRVLPNGILCVTRYPFVHWKYTQPDAMGC